MLAINKTKIDDPIFSGPNDVYRSQAVCKYRFPSPLEVTVIQYIHIRTEEIVTLLYSTRRSSMVLVIPNWLRSEFSEQKCDFRFTDDFTFLAICVFV